MQEAQVAMQTEMQDARAAFQAEIKESKESQATMQAQMEKLLKHLEG